MSALIRNWKRTLLFSLVGGISGYILSVLYMQFGST
jgi:hypothetical protein